MDQAMISRSCSLVWGIRGKKREEKRPDTHNMLYIYLGKIPKDTMLCAVLFPSCVIQMPSLPQQNISSERYELSRYIFPCSTVNNTKHPFNTILNSYRRATRIPPLLRGKIPRARLYPARMQSKRNQSICLILKMKCLGKPVRGCFTGTICATGERLLAGNRTDGGGDDDYLGRRSRSLHKWPEGLEHEERGNGIDFERFAKIFRRSH